MARTLYQLIVLVALAVPGAYSEDLRLLKYNGFQLVFDCDLRSAILFSYTIGSDTGNLERRTSFSTGPDFPSECQQFSSQSYTNDAELFGRGHLVLANHLDHLPLGIYQSNYTTNVLAQSRKLNRGAWLGTEKIIECLREEEWLHVHAESIGGNNRDRDCCSDTHGIRTARAFWQVVLSESRHIAWIVSNTSSATYSKLSNYLVSINKIEEETGIYFQTIDKAEKLIPATSSWKTLPDYDQS